MHNIDITKFSPVEICWHKCGLEIVIHKCGMLSSKFENMTCGSQDLKSVARHNYGSKINIYLKNCSITKMWQPTKQPLRPFTVR